MKRILSFIVAVYMLVVYTFFNTVYAYNVEINNAFYDVAENHWAFAQIAEMVDKGVLNGYPDGCFYPEKNITRAEMAAIIYRATNKANNVPVNSTSSFIDVADSHWANVYINAAFNNNIITGDGNGRFRPEDNIKYEEAIKMIVSAMGDLTKVENHDDDWAIGYLKYAENMRITDGVDVERGMIINRSCVAVMLYNGMNNLKKYGVKWDINDADDLGVRCFDAEDLSAEIAIGDSGGYSDFDNIYPWSEIKRCNIKSIDTGEDIVTFEGESGFSLDGKNGNVFVRIPKFYVEKYVEDGYEYCVISKYGDSPHPAFIENGEELNEIYISAFEGYIDNECLYSVSDVIPTSNHIAQDYLDAARKNGKNYSLYDMRCVDVVWTLMAVEFGCINSNRILGYGAANYMQPVKTMGLSVYEEKNTNRITVPVWAKHSKTHMPIGSNITICGEENQRKILTQAKLLNISDSQDGKYTTFEFDGPPINIDKTCFIGSAALNTNWTENCGEGSLNWHTGRAAFIDNSDNMNPIRYRWIENIFGNLWHFLPDITFNDGQMFICANMNDYKFGSIGNGYKLVDEVFTEQMDNGVKNDAINMNYWVNSMNKQLYDKGIMFGESYDKSLTSVQRFGAYYYMSCSGIKFIVNGGGFDHLYRCNILTNRAWISMDHQWYLYGARMMYKNIG